MSLASCIGPIADGLASGFGHYGKWAASGRRPAVLSLLTIIVAGGLSAGIVLQTANNDASEVFTPIESQARRDNARIDVLYPAANSSSAGEFLLRLPSGGSVWSPAAIATMDRVWNKTFGLRVTLSTGKQIGLADVCLPGPFSGCSRFVASDCLHPAERASLAGGTAASGASTPAPAVPAVSVDNRVCVRPGDGTILFVPQSMGSSVAITAGTPNATLYPWAGARVTTSSSLGLSFSFSSTSGKASEAEPRLTEADVAIEFEDAWLKAAERWQAEVQAEGWLAAFATSNSAEFALQESTNGDIVLVVVAIVLLVNFAIFSGVSCDCVRSRHAVAVGGVAAVALAIPASFGLMALAGVPYVATIGTTPFLVLAVGVDSTFVIISAINRRSLSEAPEARVSHALHEAGPAITLTTVTDVLAFVIGGTTSPFRAVLYFCLYTGTALALAFVFSLTLFVPLLAFDARRETAGRSAATCRLLPGRSSAANEASEGKDKGEGKADGAKAAGDAKAGPQSAAAPGEEGSGGGHAALEPKSASKVRSARTKGDDDVAAEESRRQNEALGESYQGKACDLVMGNCLAPVVTSPVGLAVVLVVWLALLGASGWGFTRIEEGLKLSELAVDGHHLVRYDEWNVAYFSLGFPFTVFTDEHAPIDLADGQLREALRGLPKRIGTLAEAVTATPSSFFDSLADALGPNATDTLPNAHIDQALASLLSSPVVQTQFDETVLWSRLPAGSADSSAATPVPLKNGFAKAAQAIAEGDRVLVRSARFSVRTKSLPSSVERADAMVETREAARQAVAELEPSAGRLGRAVVQFDAFVFFEADIVLAPATYMSLGLGIAAIAVVSLVLLPHLAAVFIVVIAVASIDLILLGSMPLFGTKLNTVSGINLLLAIGLSVDAVAHISHAFLHSKEPMRAAKRMVTWPLMTDDTPACCYGLIGGAERRRRAVASVLVMARPVLQGTGSSLLGLITLAFSRSSIFRIFFRILTTTIVLSLVHALVLVPALLALLGPIHDDPSPAAHTKEKSKPVAPPPAEDGV